MCGGGGGGTARDSITLKPQAQKQKKNLFVSLFSFLHLLLPLLSCLLGQVSKYARAGLVYIHPRAQIHTRDSLTPQIMPRILLAGLSSSNARHKNNKTKKSANDEKIKSATVPSND